MTFVVSTIGGARDKMMATAAVKRAWLNANHHHHQQSVNVSSLDGDLRPYWQCQQPQQQPQWTPSPDPHYRPVNVSSRHHSPSPGVEVCEQGHNALKVRTADCGPHLVSLGSGRLSTNITLIHLPEGNFQQLIVCCRHVDRALSA